MPMLKVTKTRTNGTLAQRKRKKTRITISINKISKVRAHDVPCFVFIPRWSPTRVHPPSENDVFEYFSDSNLWKAISNLIRILFTKKTPSIFISPIKTNREETFMHKAKQKFIDTEPVSEFYFSKSVLRAQRTRHDHLNLNPSLKERGRETNSCKKRSQFIN